jgi:phytoene dehydrogenase-like protein
MTKPPANTHYDVIVIGAGHNGLVAAASLAKAGKRVLVVEQRQTIGGATSTEQVFPGYRVDTGARDAGLLLPEIAAELNLEARGLRWLDNPALVFAPQPDGRSLTLWRDPKRSAAEVAAYSSTDAERYPKFLKAISRFTQVLMRMMTVTPPSLPELHAGELPPWLPAAFKLKTLGDQDMMEFMRLLAMPVADFLDEWFESDALKGAIAAGSVMGSFQGPRASGTAFMLLYHALQTGEGFRSSRFILGGMGSLAQALADTARQYGAEICTGQAVAQVILDAGRVTGVRLAGGEQISARVVVSNAEPRRTFFDLVGASNLEVGFVREVKNIRLRASLARLSFGLKRLPEFMVAGQPASREQLSGHILICPDMDYLERAYDEAKYGGIPAQPVLDIVLPTLSDPSRAPAGEHLMSVDFYYTPYSLESGDWDQRRSELLEIVLRILEAYAPGFGDTVLHSQVLTPLDLERDFGLTHGDIYHGQMGLDQLLFMRPVAGYGRYRTPVEGLYLCGAGTHPGGGVTGAPGYNAAREILRDIY